MPSRSSFFQRWRQTIMLSVGFFGVGLPFQLMFLSSWFIVWLIAGLTLMGVSIWVEHRWTYPARLRDQERLKWLSNLPRSSDGRHYIIDRAGWERHFPKDRYPGTPT